MATISPPNMTEGLRPLSIIGSYNYHLSTNRRNFTSLFPGLATGISYERLWSTISYGRVLNLSPISKNLIFQQGRNVFNGKGVAVISPKISSPSSSSTLGLLDAYDDEYGGIIVDPERLPSSANAFASILRASLSNWKLKGKKGVWLKILQEQADLVPIAIKEGFNYHHAEPGYIMLTYWIPDHEPCMLPNGPTHQIGVGGFVINENREVLVVKEKLCPCQCSGVWKLPTGFINKSEEIFSGAIREVKEETGYKMLLNSADSQLVDIIVVTRHVHKVAFEQSDLFFVCMLKPLSFEITIDEKEIQAAKWIHLDEFLGQSFYEEDHMSKRAIDICIATYENLYSGFTGHQLTSKFDGKLSYLYYNDLQKF
ncbi:NUDIX hydrolase domain [Macleaya cordata]|uniref:NUDIX hydrolase domain n=1 Tax=Macleaya cordata TaxID=56857 RepID=A0A200R0H3_MACCD|nr:NUDIX hydrolase domain [Macleaya cordata]